MTTKHEIDWGSFAAFGGADFLLRLKEGRLHWFENSGDHWPMALADVPPADLDVPVLSQLALPAQLPLNGTLEPGPLEIVRLDASLGRGPLGQ
jgi:hypothetical protein